MCEGSVSLLPLLMAKADTPVIVKQDMNLLRKRYRLCQSRLISILIFTKFLLFTA